jgi:pyruvate kinase
LGVEIPVYEVPKVQKDIVRKANKQGIYAIIATQMLESMTQNSRPTRAEANDVYNAVIDGADAVMLSGETSVGKDPVNVIRTMDQIVFLAEKNIPTINSNLMDSGQQILTESFGHIAYTLSNLFLQKNWKGKLIVISDSGHTSRWISKFRPPIDLVVITTSLRTLREMGLLWGVRGKLSNLKFIRIHFVNQSFIRS